MPKDHQPIDGQTTWSDTPATQREAVLPRTAVPTYLDETPLAVQDRHVAEGNFSLARQPQAHAGDRASFPRPSMLQNMQLVEDNLNLLNGFYFDIRWRKAEN